MIWPIYIYIKIHQHQFQSYNNYYKDIINDDMSLEINYILFYCIIMEITQLCRVAKPKINTCINAQENI